jgi:hypothetical protein
MNRLQCPLLAGTDPQTHREIEQATDTHAFDGAKTHRGDHAVLRLDQGSLLRSAVAGM